MRQNMMILVAALVLLTTRQVARAQFAGGSYTGGLVGLHSGMSGYPEVADC